MTAKHLAPEAESTPTVPVIVAHRGASGQAPENTIAALELAIAQGAAYMEVDVQLTSDGQVVLLHDPTLERTTDAALVYPDRAPWDVNTFTLEEIRRLDAGAWFHRSYTGVRVPTLQEALEAMAGRMGMWLEIKSPHLHPGLEKATADVLRSTPGGWLTEPGTCVATCFDADALARFVAEVGRDTMPYGQLAGGVPSDEELRGIAERADLFIPHDQRLEPGDLTRIRAAGLKPVFYTPNDAPTIAALVAEGAWGIIDNYPGLARDVAAGRYRPPQRGLALERLSAVDGSAGSGSAGSGSAGSVAVLRNLGPEAIDLAGWHLRDGAAHVAWTGGRESLAAGQAYEIRIERRDSSVALHQPDGALVDVAGKVA